MLVVEVHRIFLFLKYKAAGINAAVNMPSNKTPIMFLPIRGPMWSAFYSVVLLLYSMSYLEIFTD